MDNGLVEPISIIKMSQSNRELVVDFLSYKLSQKGYSWSQFNDVEENRTEAPEETEAERETPSAINGNPSWHLADSPAGNGATGRSSSLDAREVIPMAAVKQALREAGDEFELRYRRAFSDLTSQLHITPGTAYQSFEQVVNELFRDGVNWGRIVAFFSFGGALCVESVDKEMQVLVSRIASWMATYLNDHLEPWIQENGGWVRTTPLCVRPLCLFSVKILTALFGLSPLYGMVVEDISCSGDLPGFILIQEVNFGNIDDPVFRGPVSFILATLVASRFHSSNFSA